MATQQARAVGNRSGEHARVPAASPTEDLIGALCGLWLLAGTTVDGWAHANLLGELQEEGFFTPWHGVLYSGFAVTAGWTFWLAFRRRHAAPRWWLDAWPAGYRIGALGVVLFFAGGLADMVWHQVLGVELSIDAVLSPSHQVLAVGAVLLLTSPARSWWAAGGRGGPRRTAAGMLALALGTTIAAVFTMYASTFDALGATRPFDGTPGSVGFTTASQGLAAYLGSAVLITVPLVMVLRRGWTVPGLTTTLVTPVAALPALVYELSGPHTAGAVGAVLAAVVADGILVRLDQRRGPGAALRLPLAGAVAAGCVSAGHLLGLGLLHGLTWPPELWAGTVVTVAAVAALVGGLAARPVPATAD
jgi:hypothetical protein